MANIGFKFCFIQMLKLFKYSNFVDLGVLKIELVIELNSI